MANTKYSRYYTYIKPVVESPIFVSTAPYIFSIVTITLLTVFVLKPTISTILNLQKSLEENKIVLESINDKARKLSEGKQNLENLGPEVKFKIGRSLPEKSNVPSLILDLRNSLAENASISGLQIQPVIINDSSQAKIRTSLELAEVDFSFNIQGDYKALQQTLAKLHNLPRSTSLRNIVISKQANSLLLLSISGKAYFLK